MGSNVSRNSGVFSVSFWDSVGEEMDEGEISRGSRRNFVFVSSLEHSPPEDMDSVFEKNALFLQM